MLSWYLGCNDHVQHTHTHNFWEKLPASDNHIKFNNNLPFGAFTEPIQIKTRKKQWVFMFTELNKLYQSNGIKRSKTYHFQYHSEWKEEKLKSTHIMMSFYLFHLGWLSLDLFALWYSIRLNLGKALITTHSNRVNCFFKYTFDWNTIHKTFSYPELLLLLSIGIFFVWIIFECLGSLSFGIIYSISATLSKLIDLIRTNQYCLSSLSLLHFCSILLPSQAYFCIHLKLFRHIFHRFVVKLFRINKYVMETIATKSN